MVARIVYPLSINAGKPNQSDNLLAVSFGGIISLSREVWRHGNLLDDEFIRCD